MFKQIAISLCAIFVFAALAQAHPGSTHLMGTVTAVDAQTVTIKDKAGKSIVVMLDKSTKYSKDKKPVSNTELKVGMRVVIEAKMDQQMKMYTAEQVQLGAASSTAKTTPKKK